MLLYVEYINIFILTDVVKWEMGVLNCMRAIMS